VGKGKGSVKRKERRPWPGEVKLEIVRSVVEGGAGSVSEGNQAGRIRRSGFCESGGELSSETQSFLTSRSEEPMARRVRCGCANRGKPHDSRP
jgi:transposase-like protein